MASGDFDFLTLSCQQQYDGGVFPIVIDGSRVAGNAEQALAWLRQEKPTIEALLQEQGAVLFRHFPLEGVAGFDQFVRAFDYPNFQYRDSLSNAVRVNKTEHVFTANEAPADVEIFMHHEMAQTPIFPSRLFFHCEKPADSAGETPLCRSDVLWQQIREELPAVAAAFSQRGLLYTHTMPGQDDPNSGQGRSWRSTFFAESRDAAQTRMRELGYSWEWLDDGGLRATTPVLPALKTLPDGSEVFFNQLVAAYSAWKAHGQPHSSAITYGNGEPLTAEVMDRICDMAESLSVDLPWEANDTVLVDNYRVMHGRRPFTGTRKVLASLVAA